MNQTLSKLEESTIVVELDDLLNRVNTEWSILVEQVRDKIINDEINPTASRGGVFNVRSICMEALDEMRRDERRKQRALLLDKIEAELYDTIVLARLDALIRECCERVVWEEKSARAQQIYDELSDEVMKAMIDRCILEVAFDDMNALTGPFINKIDQDLVKPKVKEKPANAPTKRVLDVSDRFDEQPLEKKSRSNRTDEDLENIQENTEKCNLLNFTKTL